MTLATKTELSRRFVLKSLVVRISQLMYVLTILLCYWKGSCVLTPSNVSSTGNGNIADEHAMSGVR